MAKRVAKKSTVEADNFDSSLYNLSGTYVAPNGDVYSIYTYKVTEGSEGHAHQVFRKVEQQDDTSNS